MAKNEMNKKKNQEIPPTQQQIGLNTFQLD